jgi:Cation transporter/ATPase, N-terminus
MSTGEVDDLASMSIREQTSARFASYRPEAEELFALCQLEPDTCCSRMASSLAGLTPEEVAHRLKIYRRNLVAYERRPTLWEEPWGGPRSGSVAPWGSCRSPGSTGPCLPSC